MWYSLLRVLNIMSCDLNLKLPAPSSKNIQENCVILNLCNQSAFMLYNNIPSITSRTVYLLFAFNNMYSVRKLRTQRSDPVRKEKLPVSPFKTYTYGLTQVYHVNLQLHVGQECALPAQQNVDQGLTQSTAMR